MNKKQQKYIIKINNKNIIYFKLSILKTFYFENFLFRKLSIQKTFYSDDSESESENFILKALNFLNLNFLCGFNSFNLGSLSVQN